MKENIKKYVEPLSFEKFVENDLEGGCPTYGIPCTTYGMPIKSTDI